MPDGFNREEVYNLYDNQFTTGPAGTDLGERKQYLKKRERSATTRCCTTSP